MILALCFSLVFSNVLNAAAMVQSNRFTVFLNSENKADLSGVTVKIYNKINITAVSKALNTFETEYVSSATSDANGKISFEKPNGPFLIDFDC